MSASSTPGKLPAGSADKMCECARAEGHAFPSHRSASAAGGRAQHSPSGHADRLRMVVSRPRNQRESVNGTPSVIANPRSAWGSTCATQKYVPDGVSEYWQCGENRLAALNTCRPDHRRHIRCPSIAPVGSAGKITPSFSYAL
jgi:hypothetical protein